MHLNAQHSAALNASGFYLVAIDALCSVYSTFSHEVIPVASFEDGLNPVHYRSTFHPFAQVIERAATGEFLLVRDHLGVRPLYYYYESGRLIFGDTIPDVIRQCHTQPRLLDSEIAHWFGDVQYYTDNTLFAGIYRIEPGHMVHIKPDGRVVKSAFWQLEREGETLYYKDEREYLEHFKSLLQLSIKHATQAATAATLAAEFSAGMDSTAIYGTCATLGLNPTLFMHEPLPGSPNAQTYNPAYERAFLSQFPSATIHRVLADNFDPIHIFKDYASWFGGPAPYIFELFAHNIHKAVVCTGHTLLLSGFGGDQGVSSHIPARFILPFLIHQKQYHKAWSELAPGTPIRRLIQLVQYSHPILHASIQRTQDFKRSLRQRFKTQKRITSLHPYHRHYFKSLREQEWSFLQGPNSHEIRMRIEYSSIAAKKQGFEYRYPLLHPQLLTFYLSLPLSEKRHQNRGRYLMQRYLAHILPSVPFDTYQKREGMNIVPATMDAFKAQWRAGVFQNTFSDLPLKELTQDKSPYKAMIKTIQAFMLDHYRRTG